MITKRKKAQISLLDIANSLPVSDGFTSKEFGIYTGFAAVSAAPKVNSLARKGFITRSKKKNRFVTFTMSQTQKDAMIEAHNKANAKSVKAHRTKISKRLSERQMDEVVNEAHTMYCEHVLRKANFI